MDTSPSATRQPKQARAIRTRERILDQAEEAFAAKGFEAATLTSDILEPAGISVGSFYHQFADKRAVLYAILEERSAWREASASVEATAEEGTFAAALRQGMLGLLDDIDRHPAIWWIHFREVESADPDVRGLIEQSWAAWNGSMVAIFERWSHDATRTAGRVAYATSGLAGLLRRYLGADAAGRAEVRSQLLDDVVAACVASFAG